MTTIRITLELTPTGRWRALLDGTKLLVTSREPFYSAARVLLGEGLDPETVLEAQHKGSPIVAMRCKLGEAAKWTVQETDKGGLQRRKWRPFGGIRQGVEGVPENALEATGREDGP